MSEDRKWAKMLSPKCGIDTKILESALEELSESCYGDAKTSRDIIEELTLSCHLDQAELKKFVSEVSRSCPMDSKKLKDEIIKAKGKKELAFQAINKSGTISSPRMI